MATLKEIVIMYQSLKREWDKKPANLDRCGELLSKLKIALTQIAFLPTDEMAPSKQELLVARDILEVGAQWAIAKKDIPAFERYLAQLKCYYMDYKDNLPESTYKYQLLGLNLLCLLSQNRLAEFHTNWLQTLPTVEVYKVKHVKIVGLDKDLLLFSSPEHNMLKELELLPVKELQNNIYIKHPVSMEQYLMEGSYNKVFLARGNVPAENYNFFIDILLNTIRNEIALCIEKAYAKIGLNEAARMLFYDSVKHMKEYAQQRNWELKSDGFFFFKQEEKDTDEVIPAKDLAEQTIAYARELEMIV